MNHLTFVYLGSGFDVQPLLRFSHIVNKFIYLSLGLDQDIFLNKLSDSIKSINDQYDFEHPLLEIVSHELTEKSPIVSSMGGKFLRASGKNKILTPEEIDFYDIMLEEECAYDYEYSIKIIRNIYNGDDPPIKRIFELHFLPIEGLFFIANLPKSINNYILCTIQTKFIQVAKGPIDRHLAQGLSKPLLWLKGYEPTFSDFDQFDKEYDKYINPNNFLSYKNSAIKFSNTWVTPQGYSSDKIKFRNVKGFSNTAEIDRKTIRFKNISFIWREYTPKKAKQNEILVLPAGLLEKRGGWRYAIKEHITWEKLLHLQDPSRLPDYFISKTYFNSKPILQAEPLVELKKYLNARNCHHVALIPIGLEDEGEVLKIFAAKNPEIDFCVYLENVFEYKAIEDQTTLI